jgi:hypothetical protein
MLTQRNTLAFVMVLYGLVMISPLFPHFGIRGTFLTVALFGLTFVVFGAGRMRLSYWFLYLSLAILLLACAPTFFWMDGRYIVTSIFLIFSLFLLQLSDGRVLDSFLTLATALMLVLLAGAVIGFVLALNSVQPMFDIANTDGRPNHFFYTTFSKIRWGNVIRPSGFYDEPGAFSFMVCAVAALRHLRGRDARVTWLMLGMGFVTLSLAHLVYVLIHAMAEKLRFRNVVGIFATLLPLMLIAGYLGGFEIVEKRLLSRATITETGEIVGDNRSWRMTNAIRHMQSDPKSVLYGADPSCRFDQDTCKEKFPLMGENPLSPLVMQGLFISWPYYLALAVLFTAPLFGRKFIVSMAFGALLLQRPYLLGIGYSLIGLLVVGTTIAGIAANRYGEPNPAAGNRAVAA